MMQLPRAGLQAGRLHVCLKELCEEGVGIQLDLFLFSQSVVSDPL